MTVNPSTTLKLYIFDKIRDTARVPSIEEMGNTLGEDRAAIEAALTELAAMHLVVLDRDTGEISMAFPFSGVPTQHLVEVAGKTYYANCVWDAFGVAAALGADADITTTCGDCGDRLKFAVRGGRPISVPCTFHYAVPASQWWADIVYT